MILSATIFKPICHLLKHTPGETVINVPAPSGRIPRSLAVLQCHHERARLVIIPRSFPGFPEKPPQNAVKYKHQRVLAP